jgi:hypothetical protein
MQEKVILTYFFDVSINSIVPVRNMLSSLARPDFRNIRKWIFRLLDMLKCITIFDKRFRKKDHCSTITPHKNSSGFFTPFYLYNKSKLFTKKCDNYFRYLNEKCSHFKSHNCVISHNTPLNNNATALCVSTDHIRRYIFYFY